ncbi:TniQ family protein [Sulfitobacter sp. 1A05707]|uniref:TniQ family protein n=1 Tax=Sulfitobacter sp. 1A05707 TaxID=3368560 RepID=UPI0037455201
MSGILVPQVPLQEDESSVSWAIRTARHHVDLNLPEFLHDLQLPLPDLLAGKRSAMSKLAALTGIAFEALVAHQPERLQARQYRFRGHEFSSSFLGGNRTAYCPHCLLEDEGQGDGQRVARWPWLFKAVRTCEVHGCALQSAAKTAWSDQMRNLQTLAPDARELHRLVDQSDLRPPSPLQTYVLRRLRGKHTSALWLNSQDIEQAFRASEMVGVLAGWGAKQRLGGFNDQDWEDAGRLGFDVTGEGETGIRALFFDVLRNVELRHGKAGSHTIFGFFYEWLQFDKTGRDPGPIRTILREFILENMAVSPGTDLLGEEVVKTRRHHAHSVAVKFNLHPKTVHRAFVSRGLISSEDPDRMTGMDTCEADAAEELAGELQRAVPVAKLPTRMNATRPQVEMLLREGFLKPLDSGYRILTQVLRGVDAREVDRLLVRLTKRATYVSRATPGQVPIPQAAQEAKRYSGEIMCSLLAGDLHNVEIVDGTKGYLALLLDPSEVQSVLPRDTSHLPLTKKAAAEQLGVSLTALDLLLGLKGNTPLIEWVEDRLPGPIKVRIEQAEVNSFKRQYVTLGELIQRDGTNHWVVIGKLRAAGIDPVQDPKEIGVYLYDRLRAISVPP